MSAPARAPGSAIYMPDGFPLREYLGRLNHSGLRHRQGHYRRAVTEMDPLAFALVYMQHHLKSPETGGEISFSEFHIALADSAKRWARQDFGPAELREAWIAPRSSGKSTWLFLILPLWALAHRHRSFIIAFAHAGPQAKQHLLSLKRELTTNELLRRDFPELCRPARRAGRSEQDTQDAYLADNGTALLARGIDAASLGVKVGNERPSLILFDDVEPNESNYSAAQKQKRLDTIRHAVFPMNDRAVIMLAGTTTMHGSCVHDIVKGAEWAVEENIQPRHFKALMTDPDGTERSLWPQRWSTEYLQSIRHTRSFALNMQNEPVNPNGTFWSRTDFTYAPIRGVDRWVLAVDPAVTKNVNSDYTGLAVVGYSPTARKAVVEMATGVKLSPAEIKARVHQLCRANPGMREVIVEGNQGSDLWSEVLEPLPGGARLILTRASEGKAARFAMALSWYQAGYVSHARAHADLEDQMCAFPNVPHDDVADAVVAGLSHWMLDRPKPRSIS